MPVELRGGTQTNWRVWGEGAPDTLLLHCSLGHSGAWKGVATALDRTCLAFDLPGHGRSGPLQGGVDFQQQGMDVAESFLGDTPLDVVGHSFGATVALRLAMEHPEAVRRLVLIEPVLLCAAQGSPAFDTYFDDFAPFMAAIEAKDMMRAAELFAGFWSEGLSWDEMSEEQQQGMASLIHVIPREDPAILEDNAGILRDGWLERTDIPVLLIEGTLSPPIIGAVQDALEARLPNTQRARIEGAGHMTPLTQPNEVARLIAAFFDES